MQAQQSKGTDIVVLGRIVWGSVKAQTKKVYGTQTPAIDPKTGKEIIEWCFGLAVPKPSPQSNQHEVANFQGLWNAICTEGAKLGYTQPGGAGFHWKFDDGDGRKPDGSPYPAHSHGSIILACKTRIPPKLMAWEGNVIKQVTDDQIKCGDYVQVAINIDGHGNPNAGLYVNQSYVARFAFGEAIVNTPDPTTIFGNTAPPIPFGGSSTPMGGGTLPFQAPTNPVASQPNWQNPTGPGANVAAPMQQYQPNPAVLPQQFQQQFSNPQSAPPQQPVMQQQVPVQPQQPWQPPGFNYPQGNGQ